MSYDSPALVDAFGLDEYGNPYGVGEATGAIATVGVGSLATLAVRHFVDPSKSTTMAKVAMHQHGIGLAASALTSLAMIFWPGKAARRAGVVGGLAALASHGVLYGDDLITMATAPSAPASTSPPQNDTTFRANRTMSGPMGEWYIQRNKTLRDAADANLLQRMLGAPGRPQVISDPGARGYSVISSPGGQLGRGAPSVMGGAARHFGATVLG